MGVGILFKRNTVLMMLTSGLCAGLLVFTPLKNTFPFWILGAVMRFAQTLFHEMGHTVFSWLFGMPAIPSILTVFGSDQASGVTLTFPRSWFVQAVSFAVLAYGCYWVWLYNRRWCWLAVLFTMGVIGLAFTNTYYRLPVLYMGNGGAMFMGGFCLFRAWTCMDVRSGYARWFNAFLGFFLIFDLMQFAYKLATDAAYREMYSSSTFGGSIDNDFVQMVDLMWTWSVQNIALATLVYGAFAILVPALLACISEEEDNYL